ncbi:hypothetical protein [Sphingomonas sp. LM7]|uniref:hypothetical protein n=1 Tax=Sphingomonas sp. LM7 TaxID=1938607 RepID=UPI0009840356|nr:hypothetical protein [Sphingomonas sp. LM7]AQR75800.1 hypothetical protein BXU08_09570 [Sphingomonas sp. LM7]
MIALLLDLANILGGFLLAIALLAQSPRIGDDLARFAGRLAPFAWIVGIVALATGGYYLIVHLTSGPHVFHFEIVAIGVGLALLWDRLTGQPAEQSGTTGKGLILAIFGIIAILVGLQGLFTPDG